MERYVGMDVSLKETSICVVDDDGEIVSEGTVLSEPPAIAEFIKAKAGSAKRIGLPGRPEIRELRPMARPDRLASRSWAGRPMVGADRRASRSRADLARAPLCLVPNPHGLW